MNQRIKLLLNYIFPALGGLFVTYLYNVVDGIFVGRGIGYAALGAMFPMGGATVVAIRMGRKNKDDANHAFMTAFSLTLIMSVILMAAGMIFAGETVGPAPQMP